MAALILNLDKRCIDRKAAETGTACITCPDSALETSLFNIGNTPGTTARSRVQARF